MKSMRLNMRLGLACLAAFSAGLSVVIISLSKILLVIGALFALLWPKSVSKEDLSWQKLWTPRLVLIIIFTFAFSLLWTSAPWFQAFGAMGKYGKFLEIPALLILIRTQREAFWVLAAFLCGQIFLLVSSWLLYFNIPIIWATSSMAHDLYAVFSSNLDQGIMSAVVAALFWHLKSLAPNRFWFYVAIAMSLLALSNVFYLFIGRTGHVVGIAMISLAIFWALPKRYRLAAIFVPPLLFLLAVVSFDKVAQRLALTKAEISQYSSGVGAATSTDNRLDFWKGSVEAIAKKPLLGTGVGSWATEYNLIEHQRYSTHKDLGIGGNPHQEYLLWGVQLGIGGILIFLAFLAAVMIDMLKMNQPIARAGVSVLVALALSCLFNSSLYDAYIGDFFCLLLGTLLAYGVRNRDEDDLKKLQTTSESASLFT